MRWLNKHARLRNRLSPYLDGVLSPAETTELEAHIAACEACRVELDQLRSIVAATRDLSESDVPRSFAITPGMLEGRRAVAASAPSVSPLALGMRLASAGVAVMLAVVVIGDLGDVGSDSARQRADESQTAGEFAAIEEYAPEGDRGAAAPVPETAESAQRSEAQRAGDAGGEADAGGTAACPETAAAPTEATAGGGVGAGAGGPAEPSEATPVPQPPATATPEPAAAQADAACPAPANAFAVAPTTPPAAEPRSADLAGESASSQAAESADDGGTGISTLRVVEIVLGVSLIVLLGGIALEVLLRRRRAA